MKNENLIVRDSSADNGIGRLPANVVTPSADIFETAEAYVVSLEMPGAERESISLTLESDVLEVRAEIGPRHRDGDTILHRELRSTAYHRVFTLGEGIDRSTVDAVFEDGVLTVKLFKSQETAVKTITIH